jgi:hypothetical protein
MVTAGHALTIPDRGARKTSPLIARHVEVRAQRAPHVARVDAVLYGLGRSASAELADCVVDEHGRAADRAELTLDEFIEFR